MLFLIIEHFGSIYIASREKAAQKQRDVEYPVWKMPVLMGRTSFINVNLPNFTGSA
jgi:hypothetical protein